MGRGFRVTLASHPWLCAPRVLLWSCSLFACAGLQPTTAESTSPIAPVPAGDRAILCKELLTVKQQEGCCRPTSGLQTLPDSRGLGVGKLGSKRDAKWQHLSLAVE